MQTVPPSAGHSLTLTDRSRAVILGVEDVDCFNEQIVVLRTPLGDLTLTGSALNISQLNLDEGRLIVEGEIASVEYAGRGKQTGRSFLGKLFS